MEQTQATENLSQWFNLDEQKPWEPGVYEAEGKHSKRLYKAKWNGLIFIHPYFEDHQELQLACSRWRGLASDPNAKPKARGNRKVTRYVVMESLLVNDRAIASFEKRKVAEDYLKMNPGCPMLPNYIKKIRFRTPEAD